MGKKCLICNNRKLIKYLDLGKNVPANAFVKKSELKKKERSFPLRVYYCNKCHLAQLRDLVDRKLLFQEYAWFSSASPQLEKYFQNYAKKIYKRFPKQAKGLVLEIASNDGILLKYFKSLGSRVLGIDPAKNIAKVANKQGIPTLPMFFNTQTANTIGKKYGQAKIITANHVVAHTDNLHSMIGGVKKLLAEDGVFVFEVQYLGDLIAKNEFDNTYHEHVSYFSLAPLMTLLAKHNLKIFDVEKVEAQGGSIRVYANHEGFSRPIRSSVRKILTAEKKQELYNLKTYKNFSNKPKIIKKGLINLLKKIKKEKKKIVGYGASAKGNTMLQFCGINSKMIDYIVDDSRYKQGKFTPGTHIPIYSSKELRKNPPDYILILAWNYADSIMKKESWFKRTGGKFIKPVPRVKII